MKADEDGLPMIGHKFGSTLGARVGDDVEPTPTGTVGPGCGGMSVSPDEPERLPKHRRPPQFNGTGRDPVWRISPQALDRRLQCVPDPDDPERHWLVEPVVDMPVAEYQSLIEATRSHWQRLGLGDRDE
jgi:hypothetical protein